MKRVFILMVSVTALLATARGQEISVSGRSMIDEFILSTITIKTERIEAQAVAQVFNGSFYHATPEYNRDGGTSSCERYTLVIMEGQVSELEQTSETGELVQLTSLVKNDFMLKSESDAYIFEAALDGLYPLDWSDEPNDKRHFLSDGRWYFIRGKFFGSMKGFIVTLDQEKRVIRIDYDLEALTNQ
jgi:hypothetical protein